MIRKTLVKTTKLAKNELKDIRNLHIICQNLDGFKTKIYWNIIEDRKIPEFDDFLLYVEGNLAAYVGLFVFKEEEAELTAMVHPKYRGQGYFKTLISDALAELPKRNIKKCYFIVNRASNNGEKLAEKMQVTYSHSEFEMTANKSPEISVQNFPDLQLREYTQDDIFDLAKMDSICFETAFEKMVFRFLNSLSEKDRKVYVAIHEGQNVGKIHLRLDEKNKAYIHDLCILPEYRRKKLGTAMVLQAIQMLHKKGIKNIFLDVEGKNESAIKMYEKCGFDITAIYDFWGYEVP